MFIFNLLTDLNSTALLIVAFLITTITGVLINKKYKFGLISISFIAICFLLILYIAIDYINYFKKADNIMKTQSDWGAMGDYFGGILNPVLTFITIIILLWTTHSQNEELKKQLKRQDEETKKANFDKMFTLMLEQHNAFFLQNGFAESVTNIYKDLASEYCSSIHSHYVDFEESKKMLEKVFSNKENNTINAYLRFLYRFLKYLSENKNNIENINDYSDILRSFISDNLLHVIAINGLREPDVLSKFEEYRNLLSEFKFLEHMNLKTISKEISYDPTLKTIELYSESLKNNEEIEKSKSNLLDLDLTINSPFAIYTEYKSSAFDKNPYYINKILPALEVLVENGKLPKELLE